MYTMFSKGADLCFSAKVSRFSVGSGFTTGMTDDTLIPFPLCSGVKGVVQTSSRIKIRLIRAGVKKGELFYWCLSVYID